MACHRLSLSAVPFRSMLKACMCVSGAASSGAPVAVCLWNLHTGSMHAQGYEHAEGRMIAISTLKVLLGKLPEKLMTQWAPLFYMPLVLGLVNDEDAACRQLLAAAASDLLKVLPRCTAVPHMRPHAT